jgi:hypothetical protein
MAYLQERCPNNTQRGNFCAIPLQQVVIKPVKGSVPNKALSIHTANCPSQSCETVTLTTGQQGIATAHTTKQIIAGQHSNYTEFDW